MKYIEKGFTLFEVLVAMFITGVALLGLAQMEVYIPIPLQDAGVNF